MHRLEANILHHAKKQREQRSTKDRGFGYKKSYEYEEEIKEQRKYFINYKFSNYTGTETIDEASNRKEAIYLLKEYELSDRFGNYWISQRKCKQLDI